MSKVPLLLLGVGIAAVVAVVLAEGSSTASGKGIVGVFEKIPASDPEVLRLAALPVRNIGGQLTMRVHAGVDSSSGTSVVTLTGDPADYTAPDFVGVFGTWLTAQLANKKRVFVSRATSEDAHGFSSVLIGVDEAPTVDATEIVAG